MDERTLIELLGAFHRIRVLVLGDVMLDRFVYGSVDRISPEAPIPVLSIERTVDMPGGASNVARNVAALGAQVVLVSVTGDDTPAADLRTQLAALPTVEARLVSDPSRPTTMKTRHVANRQQILRADAESRAPLGREVEERVLREYLDALTGVDAVVFSDYGKGVLTDTLTSAALSAARDARKPVLVDPKNRSFGKYRGATVLTPNRLELEVASGHECASDEAIVAGARAILDQSVCATLAVTRGKDGMTIVRGDGAVTHLRAVARDVYDVSGAGDTVIATLSVAVASGGDLVDAAKLANIAAGIVVEKSGTAAVTPGEILAKFAQATGDLETRKHITLESALHLVDRWRELGLRVAFTNGCFDLLHPGHVALLSQARKAADRLIVGLNSDLSVRRLKGEGRPVQSEASRATVLASLACVDAVVVFPEDTPLLLIEALQPDVLVKGADYTVETVVGAELVIRRGGQVMLAELVPNHSTTNTLKRMSNNR